MKENCLKDIDVAILAGDTNDAFIIQFESEFSHALQQTESMLRQTVWQNLGVVGSQVRFPVMATVSSTKNRARHNILSGDGDAHSNATATLTPTRIQTETAK